MGGDVLDHRLAGNSGALEDLRWIQLNCSLYIGLRVDN